MFPLPPFALLVCAFLCAQLLRLNVGGVLAQPSPCTAYSPNWVVESWLDHHLCGFVHDQELTLSNVVNVERYGAVGDGLKDDTKAFKKAWKAACAMDSAVLMIPEGKDYLLRPVNFKGPCGSSLVVQLAGTLIAPSDPDAWGQMHSNAWIHFTRLNDLTVEGWGTIDGRGHSWWNRSCKRNTSNACSDAPTALRFTSVHHLRVMKLRIVNSPQIHIKLSNCYGVQAADLFINAPDDSASPNTDGIHISSTQNVRIEDTEIETGDDCVSVVGGSSDIRIRNITCGPGHGISIGSLGENGSEEYVSLVSVDGAVLTGTRFGLRIKTWKGGLGSVLRIQFQNVQMKNVSHPIIIDQSYCDSSSCLVDETTAVQVSSVCYRNIWGTSVTKQAITLACSAVEPCKNLHFENISLFSENTKTLTSSCENVQGYMRGSVNPSVDCLLVFPETPYATL